jgi:hypothetical protein
MRPARGDSASFDDFRGTIANSLAVVQGEKLTGDRRIGLPSPFCTKQPQIECAGAGSAFLSRASEKEAAISRQFRRRHTFLRSPPAARTSGSAATVTRRRCGGSAAAATGGASPRGQVGRKCQSCGGFPPALRADQFRAFAPERLGPSYDCANSVRGEHGAGDPARDRP